MTYHIPICPVCNENEVGSFFGSEHFCSPTCERLANEESEEFASHYDREQYGYVGESEDEYLSRHDEDGEPHGSYDLSDDGDALASAGFGTDEDYGYFGGEDY